MNFFKKTVSPSLPKNNIFDSLSSSFLNSISLLPFIQVPVLLILFIYLSNLKKYFKTLPDEHVFYLFYINASLCFIPFVIPQFRNNITILLSFVLFTFTCGSLLKWMYDNPVNSASTTNQIFSQSQTTVTLILTETLKIFFIVYFILLASMFSNIVIDVIKSYKKQ